MCRHLIHSREITLRRARRHIVCGSAMSIGLDLFHRGKASGIEEGGNRMAVMQSASVVGVFDSRADAEAAVDDLIDAGISSNQISVIARNEDGTVEAERSDSVTDGAMAGAAAGAGVAGLVSLGISYGVIPVIGPILAVGPLAAALISAAGGAAVAGLAGALIDAGIPEEEAKYYESEVGEGRFVVAVNGAQDSAETWRILENAGAYNYSTRE
jgi:hypothetical protein